MAMSRSSLCLGGGRLLSASFRHLATGKPHPTNVYGLPKKPATPWLNYFTSNLPVFKKSHPTLTTGEIMKKLSVEWSKLPEAKKSAMKMEYEKERIKYWKLVAAVPEAQIDASARVKKGVQVARKIKTTQSELTEMLKKTNKPTKPLTGYLMFIEDRRNSQPASSSASMSIQEKISKFSTEWKSMTDEQKAPFNKKSAEQKENYEMALILWNRKMEKDGKMAEIEMLQTRLAQLKFAEKNPL